MNRPDLNSTEVFWREKSRHRAEIAPSLVPALAALARANGINTQSRDWETQTVEAILRLMVFGGLTPQAIAAHAASTIPTQPARPQPTAPAPSAPLAVLSLS